MRVVALALTCVAVSFAPSATAQVVRYEASLGGLFETPAVPSNAFGNAVIDVNTANGALNYNVQVSGMAGTMAHIHFGPPGVAGPIVVPLAGGPTTWAGSSTLPMASLADLLAENLYVNVHSAAFPGGEVRGQLVAPRQFTAYMDGAQETPPVPTAAKGSMTVFYHPAAPSVAYSGVYSGMSTTMAHVHQGAVGVAGPIVYNLSFTPTTLSGVSPPQTQAQKFDLLSGRHYVNLHSAAFPGGEIRGQLSPGPLWANGFGVSLSRGGIVDFGIQGPPSTAGQVYWLLGSMSGTSPGLPFGGKTIPLNFDFFFDLALSQPSLFYTNSLGVLDGQAKASARLQLPPGLPPGAAGLTIHHAVVGIDLLGTGELTLVSPPVGTSLLP